MTVVAIELLFLLLLILVNGILAMAEIAVVTSRRSRLQAMAEGGRRGAASALDLAGAPEKFLSTVQVGITLVGVLAGAFGGATFAEQIAAYLSGYPLLAPYGEAVGVTVVVLLVTYFTLVWGELVPKRIALAHPELLASALARPLQALARLTSPLVRLLSASTSVTLRLIGLRVSSEPPVTTEEVEMLLELGRKAGVFTSTDLEMFRRAVKLNDRSVELLMTRRADIVWLDIADSPENLYRTILESRHSRFPVCENDPEKLLGVVSLRDLLHQVLRGGAPDVRAVLEPALFVPESTTASQLFQELKTARSQFAVVIDEHGSVMGIVTLHDVMEAIVGEIPSPESPTESAVVLRDDGSYLIDGAHPFEEFKELLGLAELPAEEGATFKTLGGFVMATLFRVPVEGDHFESAGLRFEVVDMDGRRVDKVLVTPLSDAS